MLSILFLFRFIGAVSNKRRMYFVMFDTHMLCFVLNQQVALRLSIGQKKSLFDCFLFRRYRGDRSWWCFLKSTYIIQISSFCTNVPAHSNYFFFLFSFPTDCKKSFTAKRFFIVCLFNSSTKSSSRRVFCCLTLWSLKNFKSDFYCTLRCEFRDCEIGS